MALERKNTNDPQAELSAESKAALDKVRQGFEDLKKKNDELEKQLVKGREDSITKSAVDTINVELQKSLDALDARLKNELKEREALESKINRLPLIVGSGGGDDLAKKTAAFNRTIVSWRGERFALQAGDYPHYKSALDKFLRRQEALMSDEERKAISVGSDPAGGFFVTPDTTGGIEKFVHESSAMRQMARVQTIGTDAVEGKYKLGKAGAAWVGETQARAETATVDHGAWRIPVHELYAWPEISLKALEDMSIDAAAELAVDVGEEFSRKEESAFFTGTGVGQPRGILTYAAGTPASTSVAAYEAIRQTGTGVSAGFAATNPGDIFHTIVGQTKQAFLPAAAWLMNRTTLAATRKLKDGDGTYLWEKSFQAGQPFSLLGYPVGLAEDMPAIAANSLSIVFGDLARAYRIVDRLGISTLVDPYTSTTGFVKYKTRKRVGGAVTNFEAVQLIKFA